MIIIMTIFFTSFMSLRLIPCNGKPTRITSYSNTLIDNIHTNNIYHGINSSLLINDITDHLPVFIICPNHVQRHEIRQYTNVRKNSDKSILMLRNILDHENWMGVLSTDNVNTAFENDIEIFSMHYNNCSPIKRIKIKQYKNDKPWISKRSKCACKKKKKLYLNSARIRNTHNEQVYKKF